MVLALSLMAAGCASQSGGSGAVPDAIAAPTTSPPTTSPPTTSPPTTSDSPADPGCSTDGAGAAGSTGATEVDLHRDLVYAALPEVDPELLSLDLAVPRPAGGCGPVPLVVFVHGGGFRRGDKARAVDGPHHVGSSDTTVSDKVAWATGHGWAFASVNYRLMGDPRSGSLPSAWPGEAEDVAAALAWLTGHAGDYGIDPDRVAVMGHSAGAFLAAQVGADESLMTRAGGDPTSLVCVVPIDIGGYDLTTLVDQDTTGLWPAMFPDPEHWAQASPQLRIAERSPANDWLIVTRGLPARQAMAAAMADAVVAAGGTAEVLAADPLTHNEANAVIGSTDDRVVTPTLTPFLAECFADPSQPDP